MKETDVGRYKKTLLALRDRLDGEIGRLQETVLSDAQAEGEHDQRVSEAIDKEIILESNEEAISRQIAEALNRLADGTYGRCAGCDKSIAKVRLDALPYTALCIKCEAEEEQRT